MRWRKPQLGDVKVVRKFLLFPMTFGEDSRWLEYAMVRYEYQRHYDCGDYGAVYEYNTWCAVKFEVDNHLPAVYLKNKPSQETFS